MRYESTHWAHLFWDFFNVSAWAIKNELCSRILKEYFFSEGFPISYLFAESKKRVLKSDFWRNPQLISAVDSNQPKCNFNQSPIDVGGGGEDEVLGKNNLSEQRPKQHNLHQQRPCLMSEQNKT